jgi:chromosome segregation ATPase
MFNEIEHELLQWLNAKRQHSTYLENALEKLQEVQDEIVDEKKAIEECDKKIKELKEKL